MVDVRTLSKDTAATISAEALAAFKASLTGASLNLAVPAMMTRAGSGTASSTGAPA